MTSTQKFDRSRRVYARLLHLFPQEHREQFGDSMLQVFTDQLREASQPNGGGFLNLWLRTLWDLGISAVKEQFSSPHLSAGLLEAVPNQPLPWKGVALVLIPGLAFFIAQLVQLSGQDWFYWMTYRAGYYLILPVLVVWIWRKKFPLWGLVPLGLLFRTLWNLAYRVYNGEFAYSYPRWFGWLAWGSPAGDVFRIALVLTVIAAIIALLIVIARRKLFTRNAWYWLGGFFALCAAYVAGSCLTYTDTGLQGWRFFVSVAPSVIYESIGLLVLILLGSFFARRHGRLAMLLLMGYLLPTVIYGRFTNYWNTLPDTVVNTFFLLISITVLVYRFIIALAAPVWVVRSAAPGAQRKASLITLLICVGIQAAMNIGVGIFMSLNYQYTGFTWLTWYVTFAAQLVMVAGVGLAATLYADPPPEPQSAPLLVGALENE